ncbi:MAG: hypothetical protein NTV51_31490 [Verrucomicrobia bacterium]|nr:hypothetical protein [Verrucomicrobiota bacterium]
MRAPETGATTTSSSRKASALPKARQAGRAGDERRVELAVLELAEERGRAAGAHGHVHRGKLAQERRDDRRELAGEHGLDRADAELAAAGGGAAAEGEAQVVDHGVHAKRERDGGLARGRGLHAAGVTPQEWGAGELF